jgi:hypothetical protein
MSTAAQEKGHTIDVTQVTSTPEISSVFEACEDSREVRQVLQVGASAMLYGCLSGIGRCFRSVALLFVMGV